MFAQTCLAPYGAANREAWALAGSPKKTRTSRHAMPPKAEANRHGDPEPCGPSEAEGDGEAMRASKQATFGFGSNSVHQLRGRLDDQTLQGYPAVVRGWTLAFAGPNYSWAVEDGDNPVGTATLVEAPDQCAFGTVAFLDDSQLETLDGFEGRPYVYDRRTFAAQVLKDGQWQALDVIAYVKVDSTEWYPPSEAYRCAVMRNLRGSFPWLRTLVLRDTSGRVRDEWEHPGHEHLGLAAFLFELGVRQAEPWTLPRKIKTVKADLEQAGISSTRDMVSAEFSATADALTAQEFLHVRRLLQGDVEDGQGEDNEAPDDSQAECARVDCPFMLEIANSCH